MKITTITVNAGRTFNHPHEDYSKLRPSVSMTATLDEGDDLAKATQQLQARAEQLVEDHKRSLLQSIEDLYQLSTRQAEVSGLQKELERTQRRLDEIRSEHPQLTDGQSQP